MDDLALRLGIDRLEFRLRNALRAGDRTATGQRLEASVGLAACLEALEPRWQSLLETVERVQLELEESSAKALASAACGTASATPPCPIPRPSGWG